MYDSPLATVKILLLFPTKISKKTCDWYSDGGMCIISISRLSWNHMALNFPSDFEPVVYRCHEDENFLIIESDTYIRSFLNYLRSQHLSIKFTLETYTNSQILFLDVKVNKTGIGWTLVYLAKNSCTGLSIKYESTVSNRCEYNVAEYFLDRAFQDFLFCFKVQYSSELSQTMHLPVRLL